VAAASTSFSFTAVECGCETRYSRATEMEPKGKNPLAFSSSFNGSNASRHTILRLLAEGRHILIYSKYQLCFPKSGNA
jgi:hypothetical protein